MSSRNLPLSVICQYLCPIARPCASASPAVTQTRLSVFAKSLEYAAGLSIRTRTLTHIPELRWPFCFLSLQVKHRQKRHIRQKSSRRIHEKESNLSGRR